MPNAAQSYCRDQHTAPTDGSSGKEQAPEKERIGPLGAQVASGHLSCKGPGPFFCRAHPAHGAASWAAGQLGTA